MMTAGEVKNIDNNNTGRFTNKMKSALTERTQIVVINRINV